MNLDTTTSFVGLELSTPLVIGACPLTLETDTAKEMVDSGAAAVVMPSFFEEQIEYEWFDHGNQTPIAPDQFPVSLTFSEKMNQYNGGQLAYLQCAERLRDVTSVPVIANLNGVGGGKWLSFAKRLEEAGVSAIELTLFRLAMDPDEFADDIEQDYLAGISFLCSEVTIPVIVKLLPYFTSLPNFAGRVAGAGAAGLTLFGRYPGFGRDPDSIDCRIQWELTEPGEVSMSLQWLPILRKACPKLSLASSGGATTGLHAIQLMQAGADVVMLTSPIYRHGVAALQQILDEIRTWADEHGRESVREIIGDRCRNVQTFPQAYQRAEATGQITSAEQAESKPAGGE